MAFFSEQRVAAVTGAVRPDLARLWKMADVFVLGVATPGRVRLVGRERGSEGMQSAHELAIFAENFEHMDSHARHNVHADHDIGRVGNLHSDL